MGVPEQIRKVERPINTVVVETGKEGPKQYSVLERSRVVYRKGKHPSPRNGKVIGHIYEGAFVPLVKKSKDQMPEMLSYGTAALIMDVARDILDDLCKVYPIDEACSIFVTAALRVIKPKITNNRLSTHYARTFISKFIPGVHISKNTICDLLQTIGKNRSRRFEFYNARIKSVAENNHIAIDGTLIEDNSTINDISGFSFKAKKKGIKEVSIIYAYDIENKEPICAEVFPGNKTDASSFVDFVRDNNLTKGIIVADKGFPYDAIKKELSGRQELHFFLPLKRNDKRIQEFKLHDYDSVLKGEYSKILCKKVKIEGSELWLYSFRDVFLSANELFALQTKMSKGSFNKEKLQDGMERSGTIVFISDQDLSLDDAYHCYEERWFIELLFHYVKVDNELYKTNVQNDFSVFGTHFISFISAIIISRIIKKTKTTGILEEITFGDLIEDLNSAWRMTDSPKEPQSDDGYWVNTPKYVMEYLEKLGLSTPPKTIEHRPRGRPKKEKSEPAVKRPRGRPKKNQSPPGA